MRDLKLEKDVLGSDGTKVGTVDRVIIRPDTLEVEGFIIHEGVLFSHDRIVEEEFVERIEPDGKVVLNITAEQEAQLPELASRRVMEPDRNLLDRLGEMQYLTLPSATGQVLVFSEMTDSRFAPAPDSPHQPAPVDPPTITDETNLPENTVTIAEGTDVVDAHGRKLGAVDEVIYDANEQLQAIVVEQGLIFKDYMRVPGDWIASIAGDRIQLSRTTEEVQAAGKVK